MPTDRVQEIAKQYLPVQWHFYECPEGCCHTRYDANAPERERLEAALAEMQAETRRECADLPTMLRLIDFYSRSENHSPCCSGGFDAEGVCPNVCVCGWAQLRELAAAIEAGTAQSKGE